MIDLEVIGEKLGSTDDHIYYTVMGVCKALEMGEYNDEDLDSLECRLNVEIAYWTVKKQYKRVKNLTEALELVSNEVAERELLRSEEYGDGW